MPAVGTLLRIPRRVELPGAVALTFDDGPHAAATPMVLEILERFGATATFFVVGEQVRRTGTLLSEIVAAGHRVAVHGDRHRCLLRLPRRVVAEDLRRVAETVGDAACGLHRAPYGVYSHPALREVRDHGWAPLLWSRWGRDWRSARDPAAVAADATRDLAAGDVLLLHDADDYSEPGCWRVTVAALPVILGRIEEQGLRARAVSAGQPSGSGR